MDEFKKREKGQESKYVLDQEQQFKAEARRNRMLGLWAAEHLGLTGSEADDYAVQVVHSDLEEVGDEDVFRKIRSDFDAKNIKQSDHQIRRTMDEFMATAIKQVKDET